MVDNVSLRQVNKNLRVNKDKKLLKINYSPMWRVIMGKNLKILLNVDRTN